jgi:hypothetical protein
MLHVGTRVVVTVAECRTLGPIPTYSFNFFFVADLMSISRNLKTDVIFEIGTRRRTRSMEISLALSDIFYFSTFVVFVTEYDCQVLLAARVTVTPDLILDSFTVRIQIEMSKCLL